jgi:hypothetical protein
MVFHMLIVFSDLGLSSPLDFNASLDAHKGKKFDGYNNVCRSLQERYPGLTCRISSKCCIVFSFVLFFNYHVKRL